MRSKADRAVLYCTNVVVVVAVVVRLYLYKLYVMFVWLNEFRSVYLVSLSCSGASSCSTKA